jgi:hypothetical protein
MSTQFKLSRRELLLSLPALNRRARRVRAIGHEVQDSCAEIT